MFKNISTIHLDCNTKGHADEGYAKEIWALLRQDDTVMRDEILLVCLRLYTFTQERDIGVKKELHVISLNET